MASRTPSSSTNIASNGGTNKKRRQLPVPPSCPSPILQEHGKLDQIVQKAIKNQLIRQNRSFDWDSSKKNLDIRKLKWSRSVDSPTLDETGNSTSVLDRSNHQEGKTISQPDDRFSLISNKTKQDKNNKEGKEAATQVPVVQIKETLVDLDMPKNLPSKKDRLHRAITSVLSNNSDDITFDDIEVARIVTGDLSDHLNFDVNDDIEEHLKTAHDKASDNQETQDNQANIEGNSSGVDQTTTSSLKSLKGKVESHTDKQDSSHIKDRPTTLFDRHTRKISVPSKLRQDANNHVDDGKKLNNQEETSDKTNDPPQDNDQVQQVAIPVVVQPPTPKAVHRQLGSSSRKLKSSHEKIDLDSSPTTPITGSKLSKLKTTTSFHNLRDVTQNDNKLSIEQIKKKYGKGDSSSRRVSFDVSVLRKKQPVELGDGLILPKSVTSDSKDSKSSSSSEAGKGTSNPPVTSGKDNWLTVDRDSWRKKRKDGASSHSPTPNDTNNSSNNKSMSSRKTTDLLAPSNPIHKRRSSYALEGKSRSSNELKSVTIDLGAGGKKSSATLQIDMKQVYKSLKRRNSSNRNIKASIESTSAAAANELKQRVLGNLTSSKTATTTSSSTPVTATSTTTTTITSTGITSSSPSGSGQISSRSSEHRRRTEDIARRFNEIKNASRDIKISSKSITKTTSDQISSKSQADKNQAVKVETTGEQNNHQQQDNNGVQVNQPVHKLPLTRTDGHVSITKTLPPSNTMQENSPNKSKIETLLNDDKRYPTPDRTSTSGDKNNDQSIDVNDNQLNANINCKHPDNSKSALSNDSQQTMDHDASPIKTGQSNQQTNLDDDNNKKDNSKDLDHVTDVNGSHVSSNRSNHQSNTTVSNHDGSSPTNPANHAQTQTSNKPSSPTKIGRSRKLPSIDLAVKKSIPTRRTSSTTSMSSIASEGAAAPLSPLEVSISPVFITPPTTPLDSKSVSQFSTPSTSMEYIEASPAVQESPVQSPPIIKIESSTGALTAFATAPTSPAQSSSGTPSNSPPNVSAEMGKLSESEGQSNPEFPKLPAPPPPTPAQELSSAPVSDQEIDKPPSPIFVPQEIRKSSDVSKDKVANFFSQFTSQSNIQLRSNRTNSLSLSNRKKDVIADDVKSSSRPQRRMTTSDNRYTETLRRLHERSSSGNDVSYDNEDASENKSNIRHDGNDDQIELKLGNTEYNNLQKPGSKSDHSDHDSKKENSPTTEYIPQIIITAPDSGDRKRRQNRDINPYHKGQRKSKSKRLKERRHIKKNHDDKNNNSSPTTSEDESHHVNHEVVIEPMVNNNFLSVDDSDWMSGCISKDSESSCDEHDEKKKKKKSKKHRKHKSGKESKKRNKKSNHRREELISTHDKNEEDKLVNHDDGLEQIESVTIPKQLDVVIDLQLNSSVIDILKILIKEEDISNDNTVFNLIETNLADEEGFYPLLMTLQNQYQEIIQDENHNLPLDKYDTIKEQLDSIINIHEAVDNYIATDGVSNEIVQFQKAKKIQIELQELLNSSKYFFHEKCQQIIATAMGQNKLPAEYCTLL